MMKNFIRTAVRAVFRNRSYTLINTLGLTLGVASALIIYIIMRHELSFDRYHTKKDQIFRVNTVWTREDDGGINRASQFPLGAAIRDHFPDLNATTLYIRNGALLSYDKPNGESVRFIEDEGVAFVEPDFFSLFDVIWLHGAPDILKEPNRIVLSRSLSEKYFPGENPIGHVLRMNNQYDLTISGITENPPNNTDFPFTAWVSFTTQQTGKPSPNLTNWGATISEVTTYVLNKSNTNPSTLSASITTMAKPMIDERQRPTRSYQLEPITEIHFNPEAGANTYTVSYAMLWTLGIIAFFLVAAACINFINLATALAISRAKETGVRKVLGAGRLQIIMQFLGETLAIVMISIITSLAVVELLIPQINSLFEYKLPSLIILQNDVLLFVAILAGLVTIGSGLYPAYVIAKYHPAAVLKSATYQGTHSYILRKILIVVQFIIAQSLIVGTLIVLMQLDFVRHADLGYNQEAVVTVQIPVREKNRMELLRTELSQRPEIINAAYGFAAASSFSHWTSDISYRAPGNNPKDIITDMRIADEHYISTYGIKLVAGRNFTPNDTMHEFVVNEMLVKKLGFENPQDAIGKILWFGGETPIPIVGVVHDFHTGSMQYELEPMAMAPSVRNYQTLSVRISMAQSQQALASIKTAWEKAFPEYYYDYTFLDETIARFYERETLMTKLLTIFSSIAIVIASLGLFGVISFIAHRKMKEISIRKVLGASISQIIFLFGREFGLLIILSFIIAAPVSYWLMRLWLEDFAHRITISGSVFITTLGITVLFTLISIFYRAFQAARVNPAVSLKSE